MNMPNEKAGSPAASEPDYVCIATESLATMMSRHQVLEVNNRRLVLAMAAAGHDLRQRLHMLLTMIDRLASTDGEARRKELSERAKSLIFRLSGELEQLASRAQCNEDPAAASPQRFAISNLLAQLKSDWESEAAGKCLQFNVEQPDYWVESDPHLLTVIMNNLIGNAVRHTAHGGVSITLAIDGPSVILAVSDTGPGISDEDLHRSFTFSPRPGLLYGQGMGLGLCIARSGASLLGHGFEVSTAASAGTCVRVSVPLARQPCL
jgi:signal transduction histidine kinase